MCMGLDDHVFSGTHELKLGLVLSPVGPGVGWGDGTLPV